MLRLESAERGSDSLTAKSGAKLRLELAGCSSGALTAIRGLMIRRRLAGCASGALTPKLGVRVRIGCLDGEAGGYKEARYIGDRRMKSNAIKSRPMTTADRILRPAEAAQKLGVTRQTLYAWQRLGLLPAPARLGLRAVGWKESTLDAWIASRDEGGAASAVAA